jgi:hypothetical protein
VGASRPHPSLILWNIRLIDISARTPIWTAFITHYLVSASWLRRANPTLVYLRELRRHVFSSEYTPLMTERGEHVLKFTSAQGMIRFSLWSHGGGRADRM